MVATSSSTS